MLGGGSLRPKGHDHHTGTYVAAGGLTFSGASTGRMAGCKISTMSRETASNTHLPQILLPTCCGQAM